MNRTFKALLVCALVISGSGHQNLQAAVPAKGAFPLLVSTELSIKQNRYFNNLLETRSPKLIEENKIMFLIEQLRRSPYEFERNGERYGGQKAASHLMMKYAMTRSRIKTVKDFIEFLASKSSSSGEKYYLVLNEKERYPVRTVFYNELKVLESALSELPHYQT